MQIGDLPRATGVNIEMVRYYERAGVLPPPARQFNGRRSYDAANARRLGFIRHARELGFDLSSVRVLLALQEQPEHLSSMRYPLTLKAAAGARMVPTQRCPGTCQADALHLQSQAL